MGREARPAPRLLLALTALLGAGCSRDEAVLTLHEPPPGRLLIRPDKATLVVGTGGPVAQKFEALRMTPAGPQPAGPVRWSADPPDLVQIDGQGQATVLASRGGEAIITA